MITLIEKDPQKYIRPGGEMKELTVMFSDIRGFTTISEGLTPDELVRLLNEYLGAMTDILFANLGTLDKYIGDAIMAFWGSPYPQDRSRLPRLPARLQMSAALGKLNAKWKPRGRPPIAIGIGLNTGPVNVGNMGSDKAPRVDRDGRQRESCLAPRRHHQGISDSNRDQRGHLPRGRRTNSSAANSTKSR